MPRVQRSKHRSRFHPANSSATSAARRPFKYNVQQKQTNFQRLVVALFVIRPTSLTAVQDILEKISSLAEDNDEVLGLRWRQFVHGALSVLRKTGYVEFHVQEDGEEHCRLAENGIQIMTDADAWFEDRWNRLSSLEKCRRVGQYIQWRISPSRIRPLTRRELDMENYKLEVQQQEHMKICPMRSGLEPLQNDLMDVEMPAAGPSTTHTPIRKSASLHNPTAYPTPQSLPQARTGLRSASISPPQTPSARNHSAGILEEDQNLDDDQSDNSVDIRALDKDEVTVDRVIALQERNDILQREKEDLQQKMEVLHREKEELQREKEECTHRLHQANNKAEELKGAMDHLKSQFWFSRWRSITGMTVLQKALDSAIHNRDRHEYQNVWLQARLDDIERRRIAMRQIDDAQNAPDDELLAIINKSLKC